MVLQLNDTAPDFEAETTEGKIRFHDWIGDNWAVLFSHPKDFTPVCATELMAKIKREFDRRGVKIIGLSVDPVDRHADWASDIKETQGFAPNYPMIGDADLTISKLYGMLPASKSGNSEGRTPANNQTVPNVFVIGPDKKIKLVLVHPMTTGRNFDEVLRVIDSLQLTARHSVATPANRMQGESKFSPADEVSEATIAVHWQEEGYYRPSVEFIAQANLTDPEVHKRFGLDKFPECFKEYADLLTWYKYWEKTLDTSNAPFWRWYVGGKINASYNCVDRHLEKYRNKAAIHFVPELESEPIQHVTYQELYCRVNEVAALLRDFCGLTAGDRVTLHMPMVAELPITMLACARIGVIHSQVFSGFSGKACAERIVDSGSKALITMDGYYRNGNMQDQKEKADIAYDDAAAEGHKVDKVLIWQRHPGKYSSPQPLVEGRDFIVNELIKNYRHTRIEPVEMPAEAPLFLLYTSGTTGRPKGCQHSTGGYLSYVAGTSKYIQDIHPGDVYWCMADIGWITGHSYIVYGPLALGASSVVFEGLPTYPDAGRPWRIAEELGVNIFNTSPTAIRALRRAGPDEPKKYNYHFKHMTTVGEPIEPEVWRWYYETVGKGEAVIVDTWWQTESGGFLCSTIPVLNPMKPGSAGPAVPGIHPVIYDEDGNEIPRGSGRAGNICIRNPWPGICQTVWGDPERFVNQYYARYNKKKGSTDWRDWPYFASDGAVQPADGYYRILGRIDDVINVAGHRLGTKEIESAALTVPEVAEAAVVPVADEIKGRVPDLYVSLKPGFMTNRELEERISGTVVTEISPIARPRKVWIVPDMPKTSSGKIMRRVLASISGGQDAGDVSTLANPEVMDELRRMAKQFREAQSA